MSRWTRPTSVPLPTIWSTFEGRVETNGKKRTYWIQDITDDYKDEIIRYMVDEFNAEEILGKYSTPDEVEELRKPFLDGWSDLNKYNLGLVCLTKDENDKPVVAAMNCTTLCSVYDKKQLDSDNKVLQTIRYVKDQVDPFKELNITEYLDSVGLYVPVKFRGEGLGLELLKARETLCRACGIKASLTLFSSTTSQKLADRAGFKDLYCIDFEELERRNPKFKYPGVQEHTKSLRLMYILYK